jgi:hypothetical protein
MNQICKSFLCNVIVKYADDEITAANTKWLEDRLSSFRCSFSGLLLFVLSPHSANFILCYFFSNTPCRIGFGFHCF